MALREETVLDKCDSRYIVRVPRSQVTGRSSLRNLVLLQEMQQLVMHEHGIYSAIFIDAETEQEIIRRDLERMENILLFCTVAVNVCTSTKQVFTLVHARRHGLSIEAGVRLVVVTEI